jgi:lipopolysaccharide/colanic/teichoic acid biosynthesis glycosyltransferase
MRYSGYPLLVKRALDVTIAFILLILSVPFFIVVALAIKLDSPGPVFFRQMRVGYQQRRFRCYKFRTMYAGSREGVHQEFIKKLMTRTKEESKDAAGVYKMTDDQRITPVGQVLRKFSMDELPQIFNVLKGQMSMVGPRPAIDYELPYHDRNMLRRFSVLPGITGFWQVSSRYSVDYRRMVFMDLYYIDHWSLLLDLKIMLKTILVVFKVNQSC